MEIKTKRVDLEPYLKSMSEIPSTYPVFSDEDYQQRISRLVSRMDEHRYSHIIVYGDRENFMNMEYLCGYDPRFEEALLLIDAKGKLALVVGNEGLGYSRISPLPLDRYLFQPFSLQGQPRDSSDTLTKIFKNFGISDNSHVGLVGKKYYASGLVKSSRLKSDIPAFLIDEIASLVPEEDLSNATAIMTGMQRGLRSRITTAKELAYFEHAAHKTSLAMARFLEHIEPGMDELEASSLYRIDGTPQLVYPIVNFSETSVRIGLKSPQHGNILAAGNLYMAALAYKGSLVARAGIAAGKLADLASDYRYIYEDFIVPYMKGVATWYSKMAAHTKCGEVYESVLGILDKERFNITLNPGHLIGYEEWLNSGFFRGSDETISVGNVIQCDIIAGFERPYIVGICEDGVAIADEAMLHSLQLEFPDIHRRIHLRKDFLTTVIGLQLHDSVQPLSNLCGIYPPFVFDRESILTFES